MAPRLTLIGLDAATLDVVEPLVAAGQLPNIASVLRGACGPLRSTTHPLTPHAWTTMCTGVNAARHGIWDFLERDSTGYDFEVINGSHRRAPAIWDYLSSAGQRVGLVSVPFTWPAPQFDGFSVSGFDAPAGSGSYVHPGSLADEIEQRFRDYRLDDVTPVADDGFRLDIARRACEAKTAMTLWLRDRFDPALLFVVFMASDYIHHHSWPEWEAKGSDSIVADVYRTLDAAVGELLDTNDNVMIVSDHGGGSLRGVVSLNGWLEHHGHLAYRPEPGRVSRRLRAAAAKVGRGLAPDVLDWSATSAFAYGFFGNVVINLRGRERHGIVGRNDYEPLRTEIADSLVELRSADGERVVSGVHRREELFEGPYLEKVPDLVVEFADYAWLGTGSPAVRAHGVWDTNAMRIGARGGWCGSHRPDGLFAVSGPSVVPGTRVRANIKDVAPTVLSLLDVDLPSILEGRVLDEVLASGPSSFKPAGPVLEAQPQEPRQYAPEEVRAVEDRLRALGYIE